VKPRYTALLLSLAFVLIAAVLWGTPWRVLGLVSAGVGILLAIYVLLGRLR
jgi:hypothetical protein